MNFENMNSLNLWLNLLSGNLFPLNSDNSSYPIYWKIYCVSVWLLELVHTATLISGCFFVPIEKILKDGLISLAVIAEIFIMVTRIYMQRKVVVQLIRYLNDILCVKDETMINIVKTNIKPMEIPLKCYLTIGSLSAFIWCALSLPLVFEKSTFYYVDYRMPVTYSKEPFSVNMFLLGTLMILFNNTHIFLKKVAVDVYTIYLVSLITAQYQYIALKLESIFQVRNVQNNCGDLSENYNSKTNFIVEQKIKILCRQHNSVIQ